MTKTLSFIVGLALVGGFIGHQGYLCPAEGCMITGTWMGGGVVGGLLGFATAGILPMRRVSEPGEDDGPRDAA